MRATRTERQRRILSLWHFTLARCMPPRLVRVFANQGQIVPPIYPPFFKDIADELPVLLTSKVTAIAARTGSYGDNKMLSELHNNVIIIMFRIFFPGESPGYHIFRHLYRDSYRKPRYSPERVFHNFRYLQYLFLL